jgi:hypothetical protein
MILASPLSLRKKVLEGGFRGRSPTGKVTVRWRRKKDIVFIQIWKLKTAARKGDRERRPVWPWPETVRSVIEKGQEYAAV